MDHLPLFLRVQDRRAVVIGGGAVAARKAQLLLACGARVALIAPKLGAAARELVERGRVQHTGAPFAPEQLLDAVVAIAATDSTALNQAVARAAHERSVPVNVVDDAEHSSFILPAIIDRSPVVVAIGTQGCAPVLARNLREQIEAALPARLGALARFAGRQRARVRALLRPDLRRSFWERFFAGPAATRLLAGDEAAAEQAFGQALERARSVTSPRGEVYLIGAGPGDPDLITVRALQLLQQADVVLYDKLVGEEILERSRRDARRIFVGKEAGGCRTAQERINQLLIEHAGRGLRVARLKGGDPFVFGRGGEEMAELVRAGIPVTVVPGITAGLAAAAAAGIPLTQRTLAQSVTFATGHFASDDALNWDALARPRQTVVFYMGVAQLEHIAARLRAAGAPAERPAAIIERASLPGQRVMRATLGTLCRRARSEGVSAPALLIVGEVAAADAAQALEHVLTGLPGAA